MMKVALMIRTIAKPGMTVHDFSFSAMIFLAFRPIRPTASEPERLPGKQDKSEMNSSPLCQDRTISNMHMFSSSA